MHPSTLRAPLLAALLTGPLAPGCGSNTGTSESTTEAATTGTAATTGDHPSTGDSPTTGSSPTTDSSATTGGSATGSATGTTTGATSSDHTTTAGTTGAPVNCTPILNQAGLETGFEACDDGSKRRHAAIMCPTETTTEMNPCAPMPGPAGCMADAECVDEAHGYCAQAHKLAGYCGCFYGCQADADCGKGSLCDCGVVVGRCVTATCTTNDDCEPGFGCVATRDGTAGPACSNVGEPTSYMCQTAADECHGDMDCPPDGSNSGACLFDGDHRVCGTSCALPP